MLVGDFYNSKEKFYQDNRDNSLMKKELYRSKSSFIFFPAIKINKQSFFGNWSSRNILEAVCSGYKIIPKACYDENMKTRPLEKAKPKIFVIVFIIFVVIAINVVIYFICKKYVRRNTEDRLISAPEFDNKVNLVVSNYFKMKDNI